MSNTQLINIKNLRLMINNKPVSFITKTLHSQLFNVVKEHPALTVPANEDLNNLLIFFIRRAKKTLSNTFELAPFIEAVPNKMGSYTIQYSK